MSFPISGLDKLERDLEAAQRALRSLDGAITSLKFAPTDQASVNAAVRQMEDAIDAKVRPYRGNVLVENLAKGLKENYRAAILEQAAKARHENKTNSKTQS